MKTSLICAAILSLSLSVSKGQEGEVELYFPNLVSGRLGSDLIYNNVLVLANDGDQDVQLHLDVLSNDGGLAEENTLEVVAGEIFSFGEYSWMPFLWPTAPRQIQGWARIRVPAGSEIRARHNLSARHYESFSAFSTTNTRAVSAGRHLEVTLPDITTWFDPVHAIAIVNPSSEQDAEVQISFKLHGPGHLISHFTNCQTEIVAPPLHRITHFLEDDLCERQPVNGWPPQQLDLIFSSNNPVAVSVMEFSPSTFAFSDLEVRQVE